MTKMMDNFNDSLLNLISNLEFGDIKIVKLSIEYVDGHKRGITLFPHSPDELKKLERKPSNLLRRFTRWLVGGINNED